MKPLFEKIEGIIIRTQDYGETHKIVTLFTKEKGKIACIARGAKKPKSRMAAVTQPFIHGSFLIQTGSNLGTMQQGEIIVSFRKIREDIIKTAYASYLAELTDKMLDKQSFEGYLYQQFIFSMQAIEMDKDPDIIMLMYELKVFDKAGFAPVVNRCVNCGRLEASYAFSIKEGGFLCSQCLSIDPQAVHLSETLTKLFQIFSQVDLQQIGNISVKPENKALLKQLMEAYYDQYGSYYLKSKKFLKQLDTFNYWHEN
ncbi:DNA repair protein RecO [Paraliobacillus ryukyuensis]|uniref:DNA repair protein RecO n=1 Tax=Paraliobacillus ryukyuensis TaxID=200904 RepID=UPI00277B4C37|nr:DNA repair protein RecO [Paraliobacillus ryukyuensis]